MKYKYYEIDLNDGEMTEITDEEYLEEMKEYMEEFGAEKVKGSKGILTWTGEENMLVKMRVK